jgi:L-fuconolactonase
MKLRRLGLGTARLYGYGPAQRRLGRTIVDAHHHFWDPSRNDYPWLTEELAPIRRPFGPDDLLPLLRERNVGRTVLVQTRSSLEESREFLALADAHDFIGGVVAWVDLTGDVAAQIDELRRAPGGDKLVAIRHQVHDEPDARWLLRDEVQRGLREVGRAGLAFDLLVRTRELPAAIETARLHPEMRFVVDHLGKPPIRDGGDARWDEGMQALAAEPDVYCKLSGLVTEADWQRWTPADLAPYVRRAREWFGDDRLLFGSDWPVCLLAGSYKQVVDGYITALGDVSQGARERILARNAIDFYGLE